MLHTSARLEARSRPFARALPVVPLASHAESPPPARLIDVDIAPDVGVANAVYRGAHRVAGNANKWTSSITVRGKRLHLGTFSSAKEASDAYTAASAAMRGSENDGSRGVGGRGVITSVEAEELGLAVLDIGEDVVDGARASAVGGEPTSSSRFKGVIKEGAGAVLWEAVYTTADGRAVSGGEYESEEDAARAHDALARMYDGAKAVTNFPFDAYASWVPPEEVISTGQIETRVGEFLTESEIQSALTAEKGIDVRVVPLAGRSDIADSLVFVTGRSVPHMRKMADTIARAVRKRALPGVDGAVEARDMDDWMVIDAGSIIVNVMAADVRAALDLEAFYEKMELGKDPYAGMTYDAWLDANPIPDAWLQRLERDERELSAAALERRPPSITSPLTQSPDFDRKITPRRARRGKKSA